MEEQEKHFVDLDRKSFCELATRTLCLSGESSLTEADRKELIALFFEMKATSKVPSLSDRPTKSLIMSGLVKGFTPMSTRKKLKAPIPGFVLLLPDGTAVEQQKEGCLFWKKNNSLD